MSDIHVNEQAPMQPTSSSRIWMVVTVAFVLASVLPATLVKVHYAAKIKQLEKRHYMDRHRDCARLIMWASINSQLKNISPHAFDTWLPIARVSEELDGSKRYGWINYTAASDGKGVPDGDQAGCSSLILDKQGCLREMDYESAPY